MTLSKEIEQRKIFLEKITQNNGIVITSYDQIREDISAFKSIEWFQIILDEA